MTITTFSSLVEANGKTIKENNMEVTHTISIGALVEYKLERWYGEGSCAVIHARKYVVAHSRDCDGTPLYHVGTAPISSWLEDSAIDPQWVFPHTPDNSRMYTLACEYYKLESNLSESMLTVVEVTEGLKRGEGQLKA